MQSNFAYAAKDTTGRYEPWSYEIRQPQEDEILVQVQYCGICHSDIHTAKSEWFPAQYPVVPGHEFIGKVVAMGSQKEHDDPEHYPSWNLGDIVGVGCMVDSCKDCHSCKTNRENHCNTLTYTYDSKDSKGQVTYGGYGKYVVLNRRFAVRIPTGVDYKDAAPLLCAGITTYSPIMQHNMARGNLRIGVLGLGGLGHMAVQFASKVNPTNEVVVFSRNNRKEELAKKLGAKKLVAVGDAHLGEDGQVKNGSEELKQYLCSCDYLIDTVTVGNKPLSLYVELLKPLGSLIMVALPPLSQPMVIPAFQMITKNRSIVASCIGGMKETQEMVDFAFKNNCMPMVEHIKADQVNEATERVVQGDIMFRFVIDVEDSYKECKENVKC